MHTATRSFRQKATLPLLVVLLLGMLFILGGCRSSSYITGIRMSNPETVSVFYGNFSYEGVSVTVDFSDGSNKEIPLEEEMIPEVERLKFFKMGEHQIQVVYRNKFTTTMPINVVFNQFKDSYALNGYECVYDGKPHSVTLNQELPEGATITYPRGNIFINAGTYEVVGVLEKNGYESKTLTTTLTIHAAERDATDLKFEDLTVVYDGEMHSIEAQNVPEGVEATYDIYDFEHGIRINKAVNAGKYRIVAHFVDSSPNYAKIADREAVLTIEKARYDVSQITLPDAQKEYDGLEYQASITNKDLLPTGITVDYFYKNAKGEVVKSNAPVGTYTIIAQFVGGALDNYHPIEPLTATLVVAKRVIKISDKVYFDSKTVNFDENQTHSLVVTGLPEGVEVAYENNDKVYAGEYEVIAHFTAVSENETVDVPEMSAYLIINRVRRSVKVLNEATGEYDKEFGSENIVIKDGVASVKDLDEETFAVVSIAFFDISTFDRVEPADMVVDTMYNYRITFEYVDERMNGSVILSDATDTFTYLG